MGKGLTALTSLIVALAITSLFIDIGGFELPPELARFKQTADMAIVAYFVLETVSRLILSRSKLEHLKRNWAGLFLVLLLATQLGLIRLYGEKPGFLGLLERLNVRSLTVLYVAVMKGYMLLYLLLRAVLGSYRLASLPLKPAQTVVLSFLMVILIGTLFLLTPRATPPDNRISFIDALFTATSATCVTGLIVRDTGSGFTLFGQIVILILIQIGGLGLMTMTSFFALVLGRGMGIRERVLMSDILNTRMMNRIVRLLTSILLLTFAFEAFGAALLYLTWMEEGAVGGMGRTAYYAVFHSVSAFCNAGFSLFPTSMERFRGSAPVNLIMTSLIICGGLGFTVLSVLLKLPLSPFRRNRFSLHVKLVLIVTASLLSLGTAAILALEWDNSLAGLPLKEKLLAAYFQSVTPRTAGFNTLRISELREATQLLLIILMFIGASPGGTGGGVKTSTFAITLCTLISMLRGRGSVEVFRRRIPDQIVSKAFSILTLSMLLIAVNGVLLLASEDGDPLAVIFELFSAFGTVGLSMGVTPALSTFGKAIIIATMFIGRIGPLTLALALGERRKGGEFEYPSEEVIVG